jgi:uncharacterized protein YkwD
MIPTLRTLVVVASVVLVGSGVAHHPAADRPIAVAASSASDLVADPGPAARRMGNQRVVAASPPPPPSTTAPPAADLASAVIAITNTERAAAGLGPVTAHPALTTAALVHSRDQASMRQMTHTGSDGSNAGQRIQRAGYTWRTWAENVAMGYGTAASVMSGWMGSPGHRANILNRSVVHIGVAVVTGGDGRTYWTMVLAA